MCCASRAILVFSTPLWPLIAPHRRRVVDPIDEKIISCVVADARSTYAEIGAVAGLSASAAKRRLDRLVASGAVRGFTALLDPGVLAWRTEA